MHGGSPFVEAQSPSLRELPSIASNPTKQHKMVLGPSTGLGIGQTGLGATGLGLIPNLDLKKHSKTQK